MAETFQIAVPAEFSEVIDDDHSITTHRPPRRRGWGEVVAFSVDWINTVGSVVSVVVTVEGVRRFATTVLHRRRMRGSEDEMTITASRAGRAPAQLTLRVDDPAAEDQLVEFMLRALRP